MSPIDIYSRLGFAYATNSLSSAAARQFLERVQSLFPTPIDYVLSDNSSEFKKHFDKACQEKGITHWHSALPEDERPLRTLQPNNPRRVYPLPRRETPRSSYF